MRTFNSPLSPRLLAIAIWTFSVGWLALLPPNLSAGSSFFLVLLVSTASSLARLLANDPAPSLAISTYRNRSVSQVIALAVPLLWAVVLGGKSSGTVMAILSVTAILPITSTWLASRSSTNSPSRSPQTSDSNEPTAQMKQPQSAEPIKVTGSLLDECAPALDEESESILGFSPIDFDSPSAAEITQWQTRCRRDTGESSEGGIRIEFAEGQREVTVHLSFCPPFAQSPELVTEDLDGADLEIRVAASFPFGARLAVRRPLRSNDRATRSPAETCRIGFVATSESVRRAA